MSALSIPIRGYGSNPLLTLTLTTITSMQLQIKQASRQPHVHITMQPPSKTTVCKMYSYRLQICEIKNQKEWHWPPNIKTFLTPKIVPSAARDNLGVKKVPHFLKQRDINSYNARHLIASGTYGTVSVLFRIVFLVIIYLVSLS